MASFEGFTELDFEAFEETKWSSHAFNRERLEVKLKLTTIGKMLSRDINALLPGQEMGITEERPSIFNQHRAQDLTLYFFRDEAARRSLSSILDRARSIADNVQDPAFHHRHVNLGLRVHRRGVEVGLWLHRNAWVDWKNLVQRCSTTWERDKLGDVLASLPEAVRYHRGNELVEDARPAVSVRPEEVLEDFSREGPWSIFVRPFERSDPVLKSPDFPASTLQVFSALMPLHIFVGWRRDNDFFELKEVLKEEKAKVQLQFSSLHPGDKVRVLKGLAAGRVGVVDSIERKGKVKVRLGTMVVALRVEELGRP